MFVDDAVLGRLPSVCAKDGAAAKSRLRGDAGTCAPGFAAACAEQAMSRDLV